MFKIIQTLALVIMIMLFPPAALITVSQNAVPGQMMYPVKRKIEDVVLFLAGFTPYTKAYYATALANRRYEETESLLAQGADANHSLNALVSQTSTAVNDINGIGNSTQRAQLIADLSSSIQKYDQGLAQAQQQIQRNSTVQTAPQQTSIPSQPSISTSKPVSTAVPINTPQAQATVSPQETAARQNQEEIERTRRELEELKKRLEEMARLQQTKTPQPALRPSFSPKPKSSPSPSPSIQASPSPSPSLRPSPSSSHAGTSYSGGNNISDNANTANTPNPSGQESPVPASSQNLGNIEDGN